jgi:hypothetical protein
MLKKSLTMYLSLLMLFVAVNGWATDKSISMIKDVRTGEPNNSPTSDSESKAVFDSLKHPETIVIAQRKAAKKSIPTKKANNSEEQDWEKALQANSVEGFERFKKNHPSSALVVVGETPIAEELIPTFFSFNSFAPADHAKVVRSCSAVNGGFGIRLPVVSLTQMPAYPIPLRDAIVWGLVDTTTLSGTTTLPGEFFFKKGGGKMTANGPEYNEGSQVIFGLAPPDEQGQRSSTFSIRKDIVGKTVKVLAVKENETYRVVYVKVLSNQLAINLYNHRPLPNKAIPPTRYTRG